MDEVVLISFCVVLMLVFPVLLGKWLKQQSSDSERQEQLLRDLEEISDKKDIILGKEVTVVGGDRAHHLRQERDSKGRFVKAK